MQEYTIPFPQGQQFVNYQHQKTNEMLNKFKHMNNTNGLSFKDTYNTQQGINKTSMSKNLTLIEGFGFDNSPVDNRNQSDISKVNNDINTLNTSQDTYSQSMKTLMDDSQKYLDSHNTKSAYAGQNVIFENGVKGYVTKSGVFKLYPTDDIFNSTAGKNGCGQTGRTTRIPYQVSATPKEGTIIQSDPPFAVGPPMMQGEICGFSNQNVQVVQATVPSSVKPIFKGCYKPSSSITPINNLKGKATMDSCKLTAIDTGKSVFALVNGGPGKGDCMVGDNIADATKGDIATKSHISWKSNGRRDANTGGLLKNGQIAIARHGSNDIWGTEKNYTRQLSANNKCDPAYGGYINTSNTTANYGVNC